MRSRLDIQDPTDVLDGADVADRSPEPDDDAEIRLHQNPRAAVRPLSQVRGSERDRDRASMDRG